MNHILSAVLSVCLLFQGVVGGNGKAGGSGVLGTGVAASGTFTFVQDNGSVANCQSSSTSAMTCTIATNITAGNLLILACGGFPGVVSSITDTHATWAAAAASASQLDLWFAVATTGAYNSVVVNTTGGAGSLQCRFMEFHDTGGTPSQDGAGASNTGSTNTPTGTTLTPAGSKDLFVAVGVDLIAGQIFTLTWTSAVDEGYTSGNFNPMGVGYLIATTSAAQTPSWSFTTPHNWVVMDAMFKP